MKHQHALHSGNHTFMVDIMSDPSHLDQAARPFITARIYRSDQPGHSWAWEGYLLPEMHVEFQLTYKDKVNIRGELYARGVTGKDYDTVMLDVTFGPGLSEHFSGDLLPMRV
jgi:hypothetical protein